MRIVSLLPSATEIAFALDLGPDLHGVTDECDYPPAARARRVVVRARQPAGLSAAGIDTWVGEQSAGAGLYALDEEALADIAPELILTQDLCRVCAVATGDVAAALARVGCPAHVVTLEPTTLAEVLESIVTVGDAAGVPDRGRRLKRRLDNRLDGVRAAVAGRQPVEVLVLEWLDPPFTAGHWIPDVVEAAGGIALLANPGAPSGPTDWGSVRASAPAVVILAPCGVSTADTWSQADLVPPGLLPTRTYAADLARPGPRLIDCVEALAAVLHPYAGLAERVDVMVPRPKPSGRTVGPRAHTD